MNEQFGPVWDVGKISNCYHTCNDANQLRAHQGFGGTSSYLTPWNSSAELSYAQTEEANNSITAKPLDIYSIRVYDSRITENVITENMTTNPIMEHAS